MQWLSDYKWLFDGVAGAAAIAILGYFFRKWWSRSRDQQDQQSILTAQGAKVANSPVASGSNNTQTVHAPTIHAHTVHYGHDPSSPAVSPAQNAIPSAIPKARPNLKIEAIKIGKIALQGDIWTMSPGSTWNREPLFRALLADISNVPTESENTITAKLKAAVRIGGQTYSPLPWLEEYTNTVYLEPAARKAIVLAVGKDSNLGEWRFVLNHRANHNSLNDPSAMDWTNLAPIPSGPFEILLIDVDSGALAATFKYLWTLDADLNYPILKTPKLNTM